MISFISAEQKYCCEKTKVKTDGTGGAWCAIAEKEECDPNFSSPAPTSCESTSYCRMGCCFNSNDGSCSLNTAKKTCEENNGIWNSDASCGISQCQKGCCIQGGNAFIDTATGCKYSSSALNFPYNFNPQITNEIECRMQVTSKNKGACVYEDPQTLRKTCKFVTQKECLELRKQTTGETTEQASQSFFQRVFGGENNKTITETTIEVEFFQDRLCTDDALKTDCIKTKKTTCSDDKVYFVDSCGNLANIYDSSKYEDVGYWTRVYDLDESCGYGKGNKNSATCGNCEPFDGSICGIKKTSDASPQIGNYLCRSMDCTYQGKSYSHGESWCATKEFGNKGTEDNLPGSEHFILKCNNGEITSESCDSFRKMVCSEQEVVKDFSVAKCVTNRWTSCYEQNNSKDCENKDKRDCQWIEKEISKLNVPGKNIQINAKWDSPNKICIPEFAPGFDFWEETTDAEAICARASIKCKVTYDKGLFEDNYDCKKNCFCLTQEWKDYVSGICSSLGDCGVSVNYINQEGYNEQSELFQKY